LTQPHGIFISYRREQTAAHAGRLYDRLSEAFGEDAVFMDVDSIGMGMDFARVLGKEAESCSVMLVLIGPGWAGTTDQQGRRLDNPTDFVRQEVETGLRREIPVVPVLVRGATLPQAEELPEVLRPLVRRQAFQLPDEMFRRQARDLVEQLSAHVAPRKPTPNWTASPMAKSPRVLWVSLTHTSHRVTYKHGWQFTRLLVDDVVVGRKWGKVRENQGVTESIHEFQFQLTDGINLLPSAYSVSEALGRKYPDGGKKRIRLTVDGVVLYEGGHKT
jgi:hypothetical protein